MQLRRPLLLALIWMSAWVAAHQAVAQEPAIHVRYRSADTVYLDAGRLVGLDVGDRLEVVRDGEVVALIEVVFIADSSASARAIEEWGEILAGDLARPLGALQPPPAATTPRQAPEPRVETSTPSRPRPVRRRSTRFSGVASVDYETYADDDEDDERDYDQTTASLSLRGRDLGGLPLDLRLRLRSRQVDRGEDFGDVPASEDRDRLYELSLRWAPDSDRYQVDIGRLGAGPFTGIGYLDGVSGRYRLWRSWQIGAFFGQRPELSELGFESAGTKYGIFSRWTAPERGPWEVFLAGVHEEDDRGLSREVAILETRLGSTGGRWSFFQRAELDVGDSAGNDDDQGQLTQLALTLTGRLGERSRVVVSYDRYDPVLLFEDDFEGPADQFRDLLRQGLRASLHFGRQGGFDVSISGGLREGEGDDDSTYSAGLGVRRTRPQGLSVSADLLGFSNFLTEGALATVRTRYGFRGGHSVGLTVGSTAYEQLGGEQRVSSWARLETWVELPASLFARGDLEVLLGDDAEGQRLRFGLGYRF